MGCASGCVRVFLVVLNLIFVVLGLIMIVVGSLIQFGSASMSSIDPKLTQMVSTTGGSSAVTGLNDLKEVMGNYMYLISNGGLILLIFGAFLFLISFCGLVGACCKSKIMLIIYVALLGVISLCIIAILIAFLAYRSQIREKGYEQYQLVIKTLYRGRSNPNLATNIIDTINSKLSCCGGDNYTDFYQAQNWNRTYIYKSGSTETPITLMFPLSCCNVNETFHPINVNCTIAPDNTNSHYTTPCYSYLWTMIEKYAFYIIYALAGFIVILIILMTVASVIVRSYIKENDYK